MNHAEEVVLTAIATGASLQQWLDNALADIKGITFSEYRLLSSIADSPNGSGSRVDLARAVKLTPSGVTRALRPLEKLGMVETIRDERDARRSLATLTDQGEELLTDARGVVADAIAGDRAVQEISVQQATDLLDLLTRIGR